MIAIQRSEEPDILKIKGKNKRRTLCSSYTRYKTDYNNKQRKFEFDNAIYAHSTVKETLKQMQYDKCCFCESKISHISYGDVEHFRPKGGYQQNKQDSLHKLGYYWLAYEWDNLLFSCQVCNQRYKKNLFPLENPNSRAISHKDNIDNETPLLINPAKHNPEDYISFDNRAELYAIDDNLFGKITIETLGLNRNELIEKRLEVLNLLSKLLEIFLKAKEYPNNSELQKLAKEISPTINEMAAPEFEYSAMIKAALNQND